MRPQRERRRHREQISRSHRNQSRNRFSFWRWVRLDLIAGFAALLWLLMRSGFKPTRLNYPCQQSAFAVAFGALAAPWGATWCRNRGRGSGRRRAFMTTWLIAGCALTGLFLFDPFTPDWRYAAPSEAPPDDYRPELFHVPQTRGPVEGSFGGVDDLVSLMGAYGRKWHRSNTVSRTSGPDGMINRDDVVLIKINTQWPERGGTNTDVLRGVIHQVLAHPDGFVGEVIVADNGQGLGDLSRTRNNAEIIEQSPQAVVDDFADAGWAVSTYLWDAIRSVGVNEYDAGDFRDGYVVNNTYDTETAIRVSYPKFRTAAGTYVSYRRGVWDDSTQEYTANRLVVINLPVLKTHSIYGVTAAVKNHMGVITQSQGTDSHAGVGRGGLGSVLSEIRMPNLTILDAIWILARPGSGPSAAYAVASRRDELVAGIDPVALDAWAVKHVLIPQIIHNGYTYSQYAAAQDPDNPSSTFRRYLDRSMDELLRGNKVVTNRYETAVLRAWTGDADRDGDVDGLDHRSLVDCLSGPALQVGTECLPASLNSDPYVDLTDAALFQILYTNP